jgi:hypothetical protein
MVINEMCLESILTYGHLDEVKQLKNTINQWKKQIAENKTMNIDTLIGDLCNAIGAPIASKHANTLAELMNEAHTKSTLTSKSNSITSSCVDSGSEVVVGVWKWLLAAGFDANFHFNVDTDMDRAIRQQQTTK